MTVLAPFSPLPPFQTLVDEQRAPLYRYLLAAVGPHDAADCFQETMLAALRAYPTLSHGGNLAGWLFTIAHRKVIDSARSTVRRPIPMDAVSDAAPAAPFEPVEDTGEGTVWAALRRLPAKQRSAVVLRHVAGWAYADVAEVVGCTPAAARQNVRAGLARLREDMSR